MSDRFVVPPALDRGDRVAVLSPASGLASQFPHVYDLGLERIREEFDLDPVEFPTARKSDEWLYDHPEERARDVMAAARDPEIGAIVTTIGGNDQVRMLDHLNFDVLREHPTRFFGYSDNTHLALSLWNRGIVSFYGGSVMTEYAMHGEMFDYTVDYLERALFSDSLGELHPAEEFTDDPNDWAEGPEALEEPRETEPNPGWQWANGEEKVEGRVWGGCFESLVVRLLSERGLPDPDRLDGTVLAIETSEEMPAASAVRGQLIALGERGLLERFDAVLVGRAITRTHRREPSEEKRREYRENQRTAIQEGFAEYNPDAPVVFDLDFGHTYPTAPVPIGGKVVVDPGEERIIFPGE